MDKAEQIEVPFMRIDGQLVILGETALRQAENSTHLVAKIKESPIQLNLLDTIVQVEPEDFTQPTTD